MGQRSFWSAADTARGPPEQAGERSPQLPEGAFGELTGTLIVVH